MAANSVSSGVSCVLPPCGRTLEGGISGFAISHKPPGTIRFRRTRGIVGLLQRLIHRLDNVRMVDRVIVLDRGRVREEGTFDALVATEGSLLGELYALAQDR
ncbi:hypothetical protein ABZ871_12875 [Streptomyces populi]